MRNQFGKRVIVNKGSRTAPMLPGKRAMRKLTGGDPTQMSLGNYAKMTPSGAAGLDDTYSGLMNQPQQPSVIPALNPITQETDEG
jgi:hypothetical protein